MNAAEAGNSTRRAVFLDRDGVLNAPLLVNGQTYSPASLDDVTLLPGVENACDELRKAGFLLIVVTNQPEVARGTVSREALDAINSGISKRLAIDAMYTCPHDDADGCLCRKPEPGLLLDAARDWSVDLSRSYMVGDRWRDVEAGQRAGCATVFVDRGTAGRLPAGFSAHVADLPAAAEWILGNSNGEIQRVQVASPVPDVARLRVKIFADGADTASILGLAKNPLIQGFTTNPTLMRAAGITDYESFARELLAEIPPYPISFEVFADDFAEMERQALKMTSWGDNVYVKIPVTNTRRESAAPLIRSLAERGVKLNVTALLTVDQVRTVGAALADGPSAFVSVFAGRIADTGRDPMPMMRRAVEILALHPQLQLIWASPREILNLFHADAVGCHVVTVTHDLLKKLPLIGRDLEQHSLDTVKMFYEDARSAGFVL